MERRSSTFVFPAERRGSVLTPEQIAELKSLKDRSASVAVTGSKPRIHGYLKKKGKELFASEKPRYFCCVEEYLLWFKTEESFTRYLKGVPMKNYAWLRVPLDSKEIQGYFHLSECQLTRPDEKGTRFSLQPNIEGCRRYDLNAKDRSEADRWCEALRNAIAAADTKATPTSALPWPSPVKRLPDPERDRKESSEEKDRQRRRIEGRGAVKVDLRVACRPLRKKKPVSVVLSLHSGNTAETCDALEAQTEEIVISTETVDFHTSLSFFLPADRLDSYHIMFSLASGPTSLGSVTMRAEDLFTQQATSGGAEEEVLALPLRPTAKGKSDPSYALSIRSAAVSGAWIAVTPAPLAKPITACKLTRTGDRLVLISDSAVLGYTLTKGQLEQVLHVTLLGATLISLDIAASGSVIFAGDTEGRVWLVKWEGHPETTRVALLHKTGVYAVCGPPDQSKLAISAEADGQVVTWYAAGETPAEMSRFRGSQGAVRCLAAHRDSFFSAGDDGKLRQWSRSDSGACILYEGHKAPILGLLLTTLRRNCAGSTNDNNSNGTDARVRRRRSEEEVYAITASADCTVRIWATAKLAPAAAASSSQRGESEVERSLGGSTVKLPRATLTGHQTPVRSIALLQGERYLVSGADDGTVIVWDISTIKHAHAVHTFQAHNGQVTSLAACLDRPAFFSVSEDCAVRLWDMTPFVKSAKDASSTPVAPKKALKAISKYSLTAVEVAPPPGQGHKRSAASQAIHVPQQPEALAVASDVPAMCRELQQQLAGFEERETKARMEARRAANTESLAEVHQLRTDPTLELLQYEEDWVLNMWKHEAKGDVIAAVGSDLPLTPLTAVKNAADREVWTVQMKELQGRLEALRAANTIKATGERKEALFDPATLADILRSLPEHLSSFHALPLHDSAHNDATTTKEESRCQAAFKLLEEKSKTVATSREELQAKLDAESEAIQQGLDYLKLVHTRIMRLRALKAWQEDMKESHVPKIRSALKAEPPKLRAALAAAWDSEAGRQRVEAQKTLAAQEAKHAALMEADGKARARHVEELLELLTAEKVRLARYFKIQVTKLVFRRMLQLYPSYAALEKEKFTALMLEKGEAPIEEGKRMLDLYNEAFERESVAWQKKLDKAYAQYREWYKLWAIQAKAKMERLREHDNWLLAKQKEWSEQREKALAMENIRVVDRLSRQLEQLEEKRQKQQALMARFAEEIAREPEAAPAIFQYSQERDKQAPTYEYTMGRVDKAVAARIDVMKSLAALPAQR